MQLHLNHPDTLGFLRLNYISYARAVHVDVNGRIFALAEEQVYMLLNFLDQVTDLLEDGTHGPTTE